MNNFKSTKVFDGYSTCFRQWKAETTHCKFLHGYGVSFKITFDGNLDHRNWVFDFGGMKRAENKIMGMSPKHYFKWLFDHTVVIAEDDPNAIEFQKLDELGIIQLRTMPQVGCEIFAKHIFDVVQEFLTLETDGRVSVEQVEFREHDKNSAIYRRFG